MLDYPPKTTQGNSNLKYPNHVIPKEKMKDKISKYPVVSSNTTNVQKLL